MSTTLLTAVNDLLKRASIIAGDSNALTSLTDAARQVDIDQSVQVINEANDALYRAARLSKPSQQTSSTITLVTGTRAYSLASDLVKLHWPLIDKTNSQYIYEYEPGYDVLLEIDPEQDDTGLPYYGTIRPTDGYLFLGRAPTSSDNGNVYTYQYDKDLVMSAYTDTMPFTDNTYRAMRPVYFQLWKRERRNEFDGDMFKAMLGEAARSLSRLPMRDNYCPR